MTPEFEEFLGENYYQQVRDIGRNRWAGLFKFAFTWAIIVGQNEDRTGFEDRWCYKTAEDAVEALESFDWSTYPAQEPKGWHRHPMSGRRRGPDYEMQLALGNDTEEINP